jgi:23S rRNA pseudouridine2605 synthase
MQALRLVRRPDATAPGTGLARALSKLGFCSRRQARDLVRAGRVAVNGVVRRDPEWRVDWRQARLTVDDRPLRAAATRYLALNKPRGLVTTAADEQGRATVFRCLDGAGLPFLSPVGRLDKASEGLLLFTNDTAWAARLTDPACHLDKTYHVQVDGQPDAPALQRLSAGVVCEGEHLAARHARLLRRGPKHCWLEIVLDEGRNRHIRRMLEALGFGVLRLVRVAIGPLALGPLAKGTYRELTPAEVEALASAAGRSNPASARGRSGQRMTNDE